MTMIENIDKYFKLSPDSMCDPNMDLGANLRCHRTNIGVYVWSLIPSKYFRQAVNNCVKHLRDNVLVNY